jgi:hypothetical protein
MKSFTEWKEINEIAVKFKPVKPHHKIESAISSIIKKFKDDFEDEDELIQTLYNAINHVVKNEF